MSILYNEHLTYSDLNFSHAASHHEWACVAKSYNIDTSPADWTSIPITPADRLTLQIYRLRDPSNGGGTDVATFDFSRGSKTYAATLPINAAWANLTYLYGGSPLPTPPIMVKLSSAASELQPPSSVSFHVLVQCTTFYKAGQNNYPFWYDIREFWIKPAVIPQG